MVAQVYTISDLRTRVGEVDLYTGYEDGNKTGEEHGGMGYIGQTSFT